MAAKGTIKVEGASALRRTLRKAHGSVRELSHVHRQAGEIVARAGKVTAPRRSGRLANNIRATATQTRAEVRTGGKRLPYANPVHWGWKRRNIKANPFLSQAAQKTEPSWIRLYERAMNDIVSRIKGK